MHDVVEALSHKPKMPRGMKDMRKHGVSETHVKHNHDGSHHVTFHHLKPGVESTTHSAEHMEALHDLMEERLGGKPTAEEMAE
jgi:hypothetical protein